MKQNLREFLENIGLADRDMPEFNSEDIKNAFISKEPLVALKNVFPRDFLPKVIRWIEKKLSNVSVESGSENMVGGELRAKLNKYLERDQGQKIYNENAETLVRELLRSYDEWNNQEIKPMDLPQFKI